VPFYWLIHNNSKNLKISERGEKKFQKKHVGCQQIFFQENLFFDFDGFLEILLSNITVNSSK
jgi:hypothetical protein